MTTLKIIPDFENKTAECIGYPSAGEHVEVCIVGGASLLPSSTLRFRVKFGRVTLALFPRPEVNETWETEGADLKCHLNLNTIQARRVCRTGNTVCHAILDQVGDDEHTVEPTLFFDDLFDVTSWCRESGADEPYDLDRYPDQIADLNNRVNEIGGKIDEAKAAAQAAQGSANAAYESAHAAVSAAQAANARANAAESAARVASSDASRARSDADAAVEAISRTPRIDETTNHWMVWDATERKFVDTGVVAKGEKGDDGDDGDDGVGVPSGGSQGQVLAKKSGTDFDTEWVDPHGGADVLGKLPLRPLPPYLHYLAFDDTYPADAQAFYDSVGGESLIGGCSIIRKENLVGGNFDYPYDDACSFVVNVSAAKGANADGSDRHASVGAAYLGTRLTENIVSSGVNTPFYRVLPGMTESGINDAGVFAKINVIPRDPTKDPSKGGDRQLHAFGVVRFVLDHFDNAAEAAKYIAEHYYIPDGNDSYHWIIADANDTITVEDGKTFTEFNFLTNHRFYSEDIYGSGFSRDRVIFGGRTIEEILESVKFTNAYADGWPWPDEFAGQTDSQGMIPYDATERLKAWAEAHVAPLLDANRKPAERGNGCWQTVHSCIYDFEKKTMAICVQEDFSKRYVFSVDQANVDGKRDKADLSVYGFTQWDVVFVGDQPPDGFIEAVRAGAMPIWYPHDDVGGWEMNGVEWEDEYFDMLHSGWERDEYGMSVRIKAGFTNYDDKEYVCVFMRRVSSTVIDRIAKVSQVSGKQDKIAKSGIIKGDGSGGVSAAVPSSIGGANADYRDPKDNTCHKTECLNWKPENPPSDFTFKKWQPVYDSLNRVWNWADDRWDGTGEPPFEFNWESEQDVDEDETRAWFSDSYEGLHGFYANRTAVCTKDKRFVTEDVAVKQSDIFGNDGKPSDDFATNILTKQVAISAMRYGLASTSATVKAADRTVTTVTLGTTAVTVTFPDADENGKTRDFLLRIDAASLATGGSLTITKPTGATIYGDAFPSPEATKQYLVAITETAANEFYVRTIEITIPTEG